jgi:hypothetical protein
MECTMANNAKSTFHIDILSGASFDALRGRKSVRATFKLSSNCIEAISIVANQLGIKQKSLFDHLFQDNETLNRIADHVRNARMNAPNRIQKTYVISRNALLSLEDAARQFNASRDALIEYSIQRLLPIITKERQRHERRKAIFTKIEQHVAEGRKLLEKAYTELGEEDLITDRLAAAMGVYQSAHKQMASFIEKSKSIEAFDPEDFQDIDIVVEEE